MVSHKEEEETEAVEVISEVREEKAVEVATEVEQMETFKDLQEKR